MSAISEPPRRPRLLAQNRKLRHLRGLSLRNLSFAPPAHILRSADDADIPTRAPRKKLAALQESASDVTTPTTGALHPSRSSENLSRTEPVRRSSGGAHRAGAPPVQRRASLSNAQSSPVSRQRQLEDLADAAVGHVFFSLHLPTNPEEPVYISEIGERSAVWLTIFLNTYTYPIVTGH